MLGGLADIPDPGRIEWATDAPLTENIALMAQDDLLLPWLNVADNVGLGGRLRRQHRDPEQVRDLLNRVGLSGFGNRPIGTLSGGQRQRVALARTLMEDRPVVLMDEPFSSLDVITRARLQDVAARFCCMAEPSYWSPMIRWRHCGSATRFMSWPAGQPP